MDGIKNFAKATVTDGNYDASTTLIDVITGHGDRLPDAPFNAVWWNATDYPDPSDDPTVEIVRVTGKSGDTLTITRAQEGTADSDQNLAGKTYSLIAGMTARTITEMVGNVFTGVSPYFSVDLVGDTIEIASDDVFIGDVQGNGNSTVIAVDDGENRISLIGQVATDQVVSASGPAISIVGKMPIHDAGGTLLGYLPVYGSIT